MYNTSKLITTRSKRIDLYIDESGQDTKGKIFVVAVAVVAAENREATRQFYESLEKISGKGKVKWASAEKDKRLAYLHTAMQETGPRGNIFFYRVFHQTTDYDGATVEAIASVVHSHRLPYSVDSMYIHVDGLTKPKCRNYKTRLRRLGCRRIKGVRGVRKQQDEALIRLADTLAGALGEWRKYRNEQLAKLFSQAKENGTLIEL